MEIPGDPRGTLDRLYRVVWDLGWWIEYDDPDEALDLYNCLNELPAFQEDVRRPRVWVTYAPENAAR